MVWELAPCHEISSALILKHCKNIQHTSLFPNMFQATKHIKNKKVISRREFCNGRWKSRKKASADSLWRRWEPPDVSSSGYTRSRARFSHAGSVYSGSPMSYLTMTQKHTYIFSCIHIQEENGQRWIVQMFPNLYMTGKEKHPPLRLKM